MPSINDFIERSQPDRGTRKKPAAVGSRQKPAGKKKPSKKVKAKPAVKMSHPKKPTANND